MPVTTTAVFKCDRDGVESGSIPAAPNMVSVNPPSGWARLMVDTAPADGTQPVYTVTGFLCPGCAALFETFMTEAGTLTWHTIGR
jgi:hypothetical protein